MFGSRHVRRALLVLSIVSVASCEQGPSVTGPATGFPTLSASAFSGTGSAVNGRFAHIAVRLPDGRVIVAGGISGITGLKSAELYDPTTGTWTVTGSLFYERMGLAAALLPNGRVLVAGGARFNQACADPPAGNSAEIYDPATGAWTFTGNLAQARSSALAVGLADGRVLVAGGGNRCGVVYAAAEIYNPATGTWTTTGAMRVARQSPAGVLLPDGRVLVAGGAGASPFPSLASAEIYDPGTGLWTLTGSMRDPRMWAFDDMSAASFLAVLPGGRVLAAGGLNRCNNSGCDLAFLRSAEIYDPASGAWTPTGSLAAGRWRHQLTLLADGRVLVAGGRQSSAILGSAEIFDPATGLFNSAGTLVTARQDFTATLLANGSVLLAAGQGIAGILKSAELFTANHAPVADLGPAVVQANEGAAVSFDGRASSDPDGDPLTFAWNFGDGSVGSGALVTHTYADNGSYAVVLTVSDGSASSTANARADIANVIPAVSDLGTTTLLRGETFTRDGSFADPGADSWTATVDYGDGSGGQPLALVGMTFRLSHVYAAAGTYTATVAVTDDDGGVGTAQARVSVADHPPVADAGPAANGSEGAAVAFDGRGSSDPDGDVLTLTWDFGDGSPPLGGVTPSHVYADNGTYTVTLNVFDGALISTATTTAEIANVAPAVSDLGSSSEFAGETYNAAGSFVDPGADSWTATVDYGDGSGAQPLTLDGKTFSFSHVYTGAGAFTVTVMVTDDDGGVGTAHGHVEVVASNRPPVANAGAAAHGNEGSAVAFDGRGSSDPDGDALTYSWTFGDGAAGSGPTPSHVYGDNGAYTVRLTVSDGEFEATATTSAEIANVEPAVSGFAGAELLPGESYSTAGSFSDPGADVWSATVDYGDGAGPQALVLAGKAFSLSHVYSRTGMFTVAVSVRDDDGGVGSAQATVLVRSLQDAVHGIEAAVAGLQASGALEPPTANNLRASLDAAIAKIDRGDYAGARNSLETFIGKVEGLIKTGRLTADEGQPLIDEANRILLAIAGL